MHKKQQGQILILSSLIIMVFASLGIVPILDFMSTGVTTTKNTGLHTQEIYAAEAGVYDSIWKIILIMPGVPKWPTDPPLQYSIAGGVNDKLVDVTLTKIDTQTYRIHSTATNPDTGHQSTVDSDLKIGTPGGLDLSAFTTFAMTSQGSITTKLSDDINGDVWIPNSANYTGSPPSGDMIIAPVTGWPPVSLLETYFSLLVNTSHPYSGGTIDVSNPAQSGPLYVHGVSNNNYTLTGTGNLTGTIYVDGNLALDHDADVHLDGNNIFATGSISTSPQSLVAGPGAIIAIGNIDFSPQVTPNYLFVMSVSGSVNFQPQGDFVGSVSGNVSINLQPNCSLTWEDPGVGTLDLPGLYNHIQEIKTWEIH
jgi:hypothetical protein